jgi:hypothetical protein
MIYTSDAVGFDVGYFRSVGFSVGKDTTLIIFRLSFKWVETSHFTSWINCRTT